MYIENDSDVVTCCKRECSSIPLEQGTITAQARCGGGAALPCCPTCYMCVYHIRACPDLGYLCYISNISSYTYTINIILMFITTYIYNIFIYIHDHIMM